MNLQDLKNAAENNNYAVFEDTLLGSHVDRITNKELEIDEEGMSQIFPIKNHAAYLVVVDIADTTWMQVCEKLDEAQKVATDMLYDKLMLAGE